VMAKAHFAFGKVSWKRLRNNDFFLKYLQCYLIPYHYNSLKIFDAYNIQESIVFSITCFMTCNYTLFVEQMSVT
jgi:hypothetical protein